MEYIFLFVGTALFGVVVIGHIYLTETSFIPEVLKEKRTIKKLNGKYEVFPTVKWWKILRINKNHGFVFPLLNQELLEYEKKNLIKGEEEIKILNERIKLLAEIIENYKGGEIEYKTIKDEVVSLMKDLKGGVYFSQYRKEISEQIEGLERKMPEEKKELSEEEKYTFPDLDHLIDNIKKTYPEKRDITIIKIGEEILSMENIYQMGQENENKLYQIKKRLYLMLKEKEQEWKKEKEKDDVLASSKIKEKMSKFKAKA